MAFTFNQLVTAALLRSRADEMEKAGFARIAEAMRKVAEKLDAEESEELAIAIHGHNPWKVMCGC